MYFQETRLLVKKIWVMRKKDKKLEIHKIIHFTTNIINNNRIQVKIHKTGITEITVIVGLIIDPIHNKLDKEVIFRINNKIQGNTNKFSIVIMNSIVVINVRKKRTESTNSTCKCIVQIVYEILIFLVIKNYSVVIIVNN